MWEHVTHKDGGLNTAGSRAGARARTRCWLQAFDVVQELDEPYKVRDEATVPGGQYVLILRFQHARGRDQDVRGRAGREEEVPTTPIPVRLHTKCKIKIRPLTIVDIQPGPQIPLNRLKPPSTKTL